MSVDPEDDDGRPIGHHDERDDQRRLERAWHEADQRDALDGLGGTGRHLGHWPDA